MKIDEAKRDYLEKICKKITENAKKKESKKLTTELVKRRRFAPYLSECKTY